jgi:hypothetical protein
MTGSGLFMRFADVDGRMVDVFQANTQMTDESGQAYPATVNTLLDKAIGPEGYYSILVANMHTDVVASTGSDAIVASAQARSVPVISAKQALDWVEGRNGSSFREFAWDGATLGFRIQVGAGAGGLQAMLPLRSGSKTLASVSRGGAPVPFTTQTIKGVEYAFFSAQSGVHSAVYAQ